VQDEAVYGGHDEGWWRNSFVNLRAAIKKLQDRIETGKKDLEELHRKRVLYQKPSDRVDYFSLADEISRDEEKVKALQKSLAELDSRAEGAGVPREWRQ
jgi:predicted RNase H-like nuclease (RuvC/YqgF family)